MSNTHTHTIERHFVVDKSYIHVVMKGKEVSVLILEVEQAEDAHDGRPIQAHLPCPQFPDQVGAPTPNCGLGLRE